MMNNMKQNKIEIKRGDILYIDIPYDVSKPHKQTGKRPCVVVSNDANNKFNSIIFYVPLTSKDKKYIPTHAKMTKTNCLPKDSIALCECLDSVDKSFILEKIGTVSEDDMINIENAMDVQLPRRSVRFVINKPKQFAMA